MSSDEDDYMSNEFVDSLNDVRPSLLHTHAQRREKRKVLQQEAVRKRQSEVLQNATFNNEKLQTALKRPIPEDNKGFQLLSKMGYKPGEALGKKVTKDKDVVDNRLKEPITISLKHDRGGLGREAALLELAQRRKELHRKHLQTVSGVTVSVEEFRKRTMQKAEDRFIDGALKGCQKTCENLDIEAEITTPELIWFWPERIVTETSDNNKKTDDEENLEEVKNEKMDVDDDNDDEDDNNLANAEKLELLTKYLRTAYNFCFWCGIRYKDVEDMNTNCPGLTRDDH